MSEHKPQNEAAASNTSARGFLWNTIGTGLLSLSSIFLLMAVTNIMGAVEAGIFSIGFAFAQQLYALANYEMDTYQATDISNKYRYAQFNGARLFLLIVSLIAAAGIVLLRGYDGYKVSVVLLLCAYKCADAMSRTFYAILQKNERIDLSGKILAIKIVVSSAAFAVCLATTRNMIISLTALLVSYLALMLLYEARISAQYERFSVCVDKKSMALLAECFSLFAGAFILIYICNQPKYVIDAAGSEEMNTIYNIVVMPAFAVNLLSQSLFKPMLTGLSRMWKDGEKARFRKRVIGITLFIAFCTLFCIGAGWLLGTQVLSWLYGVSVVEYKSELSLLLLTGGFNAVANFAFNVIAVFRGQKVILPIYLCGLVISLLIAKPLFQAMGLLGACYAYLIPIAVIAIILLVHIIWKCRPAQGNKS